MASYALNNKTTGERIEASEAVYLDHGLIYYCPNPNCRVQMHIVQASVPYFTAYKATPHIKYCFYASKSLFDPGKYEESSFNLDEAIQFLLAEGESTANTRGKQYQEHEHSSRLPIKRLSVLYAMCKSRGIDQSYNGVPIKSIIFDNRCSGELPQTISGFRIVECQTKNSNYLDYDREQLTITLYAPATSLRKGTFVLQFEDQELFKERQKLVFSNRDKIIVVAGIWKSGEDAQSRYTQVSSKRQIVVIKE